MRIKKISLLIILLLIISGCTSKINIDISDNIINEEIIIDNQSVPLSNFPNYVPAFKKDNIIDTEPDTKLEGIEYYKKEIKDNLIHYSYSFRTEEYNNSHTMKDFFSSSSLESSRWTGFLEAYTSSDDIYVFDMYPDLTQLEVNITTKLVVEESNADSVKDNTYTWVFTPNNKNKSIYIKMRNYYYNTLHPVQAQKDKEKNKDSNSSKNKSNSSSLDSNNEKPVIWFEEDNEENSSNNSQSMLLLLALGVVVGFILLVFIINIVTNKKNR